MLFKEIYQSRKVVIIEDFEDIENNALDVPNVSNATVTTRGYEYKAASQNRRMIRQFEAELKKNLLKSAGMLKATSGNAVK